MEIKSLAMCIKIIILVSSVLSPLVSLSKKNVVLGGFF